MLLRSRSSTSCLTSSTVIFVVTNYSEYNINGGLVNQSKKLTKFFYCQPKICKFVRCSSGLWWCGRNIFSCNCTTGNECSVVTITEICGNESNVTVSIFTFEAGLLSVGPGVSVSHSEVKLVTCLFSEVGESEFGVGGAVQPSSKGHTGR